MREKRFSNKVAMVTGAASGIGLATARRLVAEGATIVVGDRNPVPPGLASVSLSLDVTRESDWESAYEILMLKHGKLDLLIHCAGISAGSPLIDMSYEEWRKVLAVNLDGAFLATRFALKAMGTTGGSIIHVSSASGIKPASGAAAYSASKAGLIMLTKAAAKECLDKKLPIRVNAVCPGGVKTPLWSSMPFFRELVIQTGSEEAAFASLASGPGGPFADPDDIVNAILFLASDEARFITGTDLPIDGGYIL